MKHLYLLFGFTFLLVFQLFSQSSLDEVAETKYGYNWVKYTSSNLSVDTYWKNFSEDYGLSDQDEMRLFREDRDDIGFSHYRFHQYYNGIRVEAGTYLLHEKNNFLVSGNGKLVANLNLTTNPSIEETEALEKALLFIGADEYMWEHQGNEILIKRMENDPNATYYPSPELVIIDPTYSQKGTKYRLAYKMDIYSVSPMSRNWVFVDAHTGEVIHQQNRIHTIDVPGVAETAYSGTQNMTTDSSNATYRLREAGRGMGIETYDMNTSTDYNVAVDFFDEDNFWNNFNPELDEYATDAHWGTERTYDYFLEKFGRQGLDDNDMLMVSYVHYDLNYFNAFWNGNFMTYGDGNSSGTPLVAIDIVAHEMTHGVTNFTANLIYMDEYGALNESFSDVFGAAIEHFSKPDADWFIGEDIGTTLRSMNNPGQFGDPDTYKGTNWVTGTQDNGGVHTNSGVQNFWFYLLSEGGVGTSDFGATYDVSGVTIDTAAAIAYRNLVYYLMETSEYIDAREGSIQAATDLYGECSNPVQQTMKAWHAVGIGKFDFDNEISILSPTSGCSLSDEEFLSIELKINACVPNLEPGDKIPFYYRLDGGDKVRDSLEVSTFVANGDIINFTFTEPLDLIEFQTYVLDCWTEFPPNAGYFNSGINSYVIENKFELDVSVREVTSPVPTCDLSSSEVVTIKVEHLGCSPIPAGESVSLNYSVNGGVNVDENYTFASTFNPDDVFFYTFTTTADLSEVGFKNIVSWITYAPDILNSNDASNTEVTKAAKLKDSPIRFEDLDNVVDSFFIITNVQSAASITEIAANTGTYGVQMTGKNPFTEDGEFLPEIELGGGSVWNRNHDYGAKVCFCVDASDWTQAWVKFDLKQTKAHVYPILNLTMPFEELAVRTLVNGNQFGQNYEDAKSFNSAPYNTFEVDLSAFAGTQFEFCFETRTFVGPDAEMVPVLGKGDNALLDNIRFAADLSITNTEELTTFDKVSVSPNPSNGNFNIQITGIDYEEVNIQIFDLLGRKVFENSNQLLNDNQLLNIQSGIKSPGVYILRIEGADKSYSQKLIFE